MYFFETKHQIILHVEFRDGFCSLYFIHAHTSGLPGCASRSRRLMHEEEEEEQGGGRRRHQENKPPIGLGSAPALVQPLISCEPVSHTRL